MSYVLLGADNKVLCETIVHKLQAAKVEPCDSKLYDFDNIFYRIFIDPDERSKMLLSLESPNFRDIRETGSEDWIREVLGEYLTTVTSEGCNFEIALDDEKVSAKADEIGQLFSKLRIYALGGPLYHYCKALQVGQALSEPFSFPFRSDTHMWIVPKGDRVTVIFGFEFPINSDRIIGNQILTEFVEVRRQRDVQQAPVISFDKKAPSELKNEKLPNWNKEAFLGYFSILLVAHHVKGEKLQKTVENVIGFRAYLTYHIKCAKAFFHQSMRARVKSMLKILNRARYEEDSQKRKKRKIIVSAT